MAPGGLTFKTEKLTEPKEVQQRTAEHIPFVVLVPFRYVS